MTTRLIGVDELGNRVGQDHPRAVLSDAEVEMLFALRAEGWGYRRLASKMEISKRSVRDILHGRTRRRTPSGWRTVRIREAEVGTVAPCSLNTKAPPAL